MKLAEIVGYQLDMARCATLRSIHRLLDGSGLRPADTTALALVREQPGCSQTVLGRALAANRSVGMKVANRLEARGLLTRAEGRDGRSKGLYITPEGERILAELLDLHGEAEIRLAAHLEPEERGELLRLLSKVQQAIEEEEAELRHSSTIRSAGSPAGRETAGHHA
ncbi:MarR family transcriptional regulator [Altererythrobacter sp. CC-YST694]|uniref:MarR family winged helix-turn-helix transcriptional regulator n=1 Tax=Altererythrobacter sp. CC-YST694 TaxID=2755038 RepID=UPI001D005675|nr:MarR family transcriptional regulator [Altererythrobacter sp. CC-YST694]MCB5423667.1 MarR family transcriptional regulator [Altererythrobacter sp. CC-YST694]